MRVVPAQMLEGGGGEAGWRVRGGCCAYMHREARVQHVGPTCCIRRTARTFTMSRSTPAAKLSSAVRMHALHMVGPACHCLCALQVPSLRHAPFTQPKIPATLAHTRILMSQTAGNVKSSGSSGSTISALLASRACCI